MIFLAVRQILTLYCLILFLINVRQILTSYCMIFLNSSSDSDILYMLQILILDEFILLLTCNLKENMCVIVIDTYN